MKKFIIIFSFLTISFITSCSIILAGSNNNWNLPRPDLLMNMYNMNWGITDDEPESFKAFALTHNTQKLIDELKSGLNENSAQIIDAALNVIINMPDRKHSKYFYVDIQNFEKTFGTEKHRLASDKLTTEFNKIRDNYKLSKGDYNQSLFVYHHGLKNANQKLKNYIKGKAFIDAGAYIGDSALVFSEYEPCKIYSFDISAKNIKEYKKTMQINNIPKDLYKIHKLALADKKAVYRFKDKGEATGSIFKNNGFVIFSTDLDSFMKNKKEKTGFIKINIEGAAYKALKGMKTTIKENKPVLFITINHSPEEFFYTKPLLEEITKDLYYKIDIVNYEYNPYSNSEISILAYPVELDK